MRVLVSLCFLIFSIAVLAQERLLTPPFALHKSVPRNADTKLDSMKTDDFTQNFIVQPYSNHEFIYDIDGNLVTTFSKLYNIDSLKWELKAKGEIDYFPDSLNIWHKNYLPHLDSFRHVGNWKEKYQSNLLVSYSIHSREGGFSTTIRKTREHFLKYSANNLIQDSVVGYDSGKVSGYGFTNYQYQNNNLISKKSFSNVSLGVNVLHQVDSFIYSGKLLDSALFFEIDTVKRLTRKKVYTYNGLGQLKTMKFFKLQFGDSLLETSNYEMKYDSKGNLVEMQTNGYFFNNWPNSPPIEIKEKVILDFDVSKPRSEIIMLDDYIDIYPSRIDYDEFLKGNYHSKLNEINKYYWSESDSTWKLNYHRKFYYSPGTFSSLNEVEKSNNLSVFPNPVKVGESLNLKTNDPIAEVKVFNSVGQLCFSQNGGSKILNLNLKSGIYFLIVNLKEGRIEQHKFVVN